MSVVGKAVELMKEVDKHDTHIVIASKIDTDRVYVMKVKLGSMKELIEFVGSLGEFTE